MRISDWSSDVCSSDLKNAERRVDREQKAQRDAKQRGMCQRIAEIGHAPPDHEAAERPCDDGHAEPAEQSPDHEIVQDHLCSPVAIPASAAARMSCASPDRSWWWSWAWV